MGLIQRTANNAIFGAALATLVAVVFTGCSGLENRKIRKASIELADRLSVPKPAKDPSLSSVAQRVYIDSSWSMKGFVGDIRSGTRSTFDDFIDVMPDVLPGCKVFRYGHTPSSSEQPSTNLKYSDVTNAAEFNNQLHDPRLYEMKFNPDDVLLSSIVIEKQPALSIILTDGVESDSAGQVNTVVVNAIRDWMNEGKLFAILIMKSRFSGPFYSERVRSMLDDASVENRPFYAFVLSPTTREFDDLYDKLKRRFPKIRALVFSDESMQCRAELPSTISASYAIEQPPENSYYWQMLKIKDVPASGEDPLIYKYLYEIKATYPVKSLGVRLSAKLHKWEPSQKQFQEEGSLLPTDDKIVVTEENSDRGPSGINTQAFLLKPKGLFSTDPQSDYDFYSIEQSPYIKEVSDEVVSLSTRDDSSTGSADRTYRFQELVLALLDVHLKNRVAPLIVPQVYFTVARR